MKTANLNAKGTRLLLALVRYLSAHYNLSSSARAAAAAFRYYLDDGDENLRTFGMAALSRELERALADCGGAAGIDAAKYQAKANGPAMGPLGVAGVKHTARGARPSLPN